MLFLLAFTIGACGESEINEADTPAGGETSSDVDSPAGGGDTPPGGETTKEPEHTFTDAEDWQEKTIELINAHRAKGASCGGQELEPVAPLLFDEEITPRLNKAAEHHAKDMDEEGIAGHFDEKNGGDRGVLARIWVENRDWTGELERGWSYVGEAVASGAKSPEETVAEWMSDDRHCDVLMNENGAYAGLARQGDSWVLVTADTLETDATDITPDEPWKQELLRLLNDYRKAPSGHCSDRSAEGPVQYSEHFEAIALYKALDIEYTGKKGWNTSDNLDVGDLAAYMLPGHWSGLDLLVYVGKDASPQKALDSWLSQRCFIAMMPNVGFARKGNAWVIAAGSGGRG